MGTFRCNGLAVASSGAIGTILWDGSETDPRLQEPGRAAKVCECEPTGNKNLNNLQDARGSKKPRSFRFYGRDR